MNTTTQTKWTPEEVEYLQEWAEHLPAEQIAKKLKRTTAQVQDKSHYFGLSIKPVYDNWSTTELGKLLGISHETIRKWVIKGELIARQAKKIKGSVYRINRKDFKVFYLQYRDRKYCFRRVNQESLNWILND